MQIILHGLASGRSQIIEVQSLDLNKTLLDFLRERDVPIASSCAGEGVCKKCVIQNEWLTCMMTVEQFLKNQADGVVHVSYL
jgi:ferredoxin